ncbi:MAG: hypothetical protein RMJ36_02245 [Candidatus Calescibacterium sp.]|nr:hypothetical protein [Candidatus Calescibacterium sp.]MDW8132459.1 hypothetical protein [Candidatus Calescibacterium sp.]
MIKKIFKIFKIFQIIRLIPIIVKIIITTICLIIITLIEAINNEENIKQKMNKNKLKNTLKFSTNQLIIKMFENIFSSSLILMIISYLLDTKKIIERFNNYINTCIDKIFDEIVVLKIKTLFKKEVKGGKLN